MQEEPVNQKTIVSNQDEASIFHPKAVRKTIKQAIESFNVPRWTILNEDQTPRTCCDCGEPLEIQSIRGISICLNAQYFGDIQVEVLCEHCSSSYFIHFRKSCLSMIEFGVNVMGSFPKGKPVLQHEINLYDNNIADIIIDDVSKATEESICQS